MNERDDWLSPAVFVAGIDLGGDTGGSPPSPMMVSVELLNAERATTSKLRAENASLRAELARARPYQPPGQNLPAPEPGHWPLTSIPWPNLPAPAKAPTKVFYEEAMDIPPASIGLINRQPSVVWQNRNLKDLLEQIHVGMQRIEPIHADSKPPAHRYMGIGCYPLPPGGDLG